MAHPVHQVARTVNARTLSCSSAWTCRASAANDASARTPESKTLPAGPDASLRTAWGKSLKNPLRFGAKANCIGPGESTLLRNWRSNIEEGDASFSAPTNSMGCPVLRIQFRRDETASKKNGVNMWQVERGLSTRTLLRRRATRRLITCAPEEGRCRSEKPGSRPFLLVRFCQSVDECIGRHLQRQLFISC